MPGFAGLISGALGGAAKGYTDYAKQRMDIDLKKELMAAEEEKQLRIDEITRNRNISDIGRKAEATAAAAPVLAQGEADAAPIKAAGEARGQVAKTSTPGYTESVQAESDAKESTSAKDFRSAGVRKIDAEIDKIQNDIANGDPKSTSRDRLTTIVNSANATIKSLNDGSRGKTAEEKAEWKRQMDAAVALRDRATSLLNENLVGKSKDKPAAGGSATSGPTTDRPPLAQFNR